MSKCVSDECEWVSDGVVRERVFERVSEGGRVRHRGGSEMMYPQV